MYNKKGWYGNSRAHALAAKGIKSKPSLSTERIFLAKKAESDVPLHQIRQDLANGMDFRQLQMKYPAMDEETLRKRAIKMYDSNQGNQALTTINEYPPKLISVLAKSSPRLKSSLQDTLANDQARSFINDKKLEEVRQSL